MAEDLRGPLEARLLGVERGLEAMDADLGVLRRQLVALSQGIWDGWSDVGPIHSATPPPPPPPPPPPTGGHIPTCTGALLATLYFHDPVYGSGSIVWDGAKWTGCILGAFPGYTADGCAAVGSTAIHYDLLTSGFFRMRWVKAGSCPTSSVCTDATNASSAAVSAAVVDSCVPFRAHHVARSAQGFKILGDASDTGVIVTLADTPI